MFLRSQCHGGHSRRHRHDRGNPLDHIFGTYHFARFFTRPPDNLGTRLQHSHFSRIQFAPKIRQYYTLPLRNFSAREISRADSRFLIVSLLSKAFFPCAKATSTLTIDPLK